MKLSLNVGHDNGGPCYHPLIIELSVSRSGQCYSLSAWLCRSKWVFFFSFLPGCLSLHSNMECTWAHTVNKAGKVSHCRVIADVPSPYWETFNFHLCLAFLVSNRDCDKWSFQSKETVGIFSTRLCPHFPLLLGLAISTWTSPLGDARQQSRNVWSWSIFLFYTQMEKEKRVWKKNLFLDRISCTAVKMLNRPPIPSSLPIVFFFSLNCVCCWNVH